MFTFGLYKHLTRPSLHPDLQRCLAGGTLSHPLLSLDWVDPRQYARINRLYEYRRGLKRRPPTEWDRLRPDLTLKARLDWYLSEVSKYHETSESYLPFEKHDQILGEIWTEPEYVALCCDAFVTLYHGVTRPTPGPLIAMMTESERQFLAGLPDRVQVFRGHVPVSENGSSWTLSPTVAFAWAGRGEPGYQSLQLTSSPAEYMFFAPIVTVGTIERSKILAYISRVDEDEILVMPGDVVDRKSYEVIRE